MSIRLRLLLAGLLILLLFLGFTAWLLDRAFNDYQLQAQRESMRLQQLLLARAADWEHGDWRLTGLDEARFDMLDSGLYAFIAEPAGGLLWSSPSAETFAANQREQLQAELHRLAVSAPEIGDDAFSTCLPGGAYYCYGQRVAWGSSGPEALFVVLEESGQVGAARESWRERLLVLCIGLTVLLLLAQAMVVHWGMRPLREVAETVGRLERGEADSLQRDYPAELRPLTDNLRHLLVSERQRRERVRNTMDRLAHVLKSPLMLLRNAEDDAPDFRQLVREQSERMLGVVEGELARARLDGRHADILGRPVAVQPVLQRIADAYARLPRGAAAAGPLHIDTADIDTTALFRGDERDLQDLFGTLLENAMKYARERIEVRAQLVHEDDTVSLRLQLDDDGEGIPPGLEGAMLQRGARADTASPGQGLGLAIVIDIVSAYGGGLHVGRSPLGGARFTITLPGS